MNETMIVRKCSAIEMLNRQKETDMMTTLKSQTDSKNGGSFRTDAERWLAVTRRDPRADGRFFYSVSTTGVYCRPTCAAKLARRENVSFHATAAEAEQAGFRACKRCHPRDPVPGRVHVEAVEKACALIREAEETPDLDTLATAVKLSPSHFHRVFKSLTGLTPKAYATAHRAQRAREELKRGSSVTAAIYNAGFNSNGRFYATSRRMLGMKPAAFRAGGEGAQIRFAVGECSLGSILVAASKLGICSIALGDDPQELVRGLQDQFARAELASGGREFERWVAQVVAFVERPAAGLRLPLDIQGTAFQQRVWQALREIPCGQTRSYSELAKQLGEPKAVRAVARACATNRLAVAIPCHRVVRTDGSLSGYRWGIQRKAKLLKIERAPAVGGAEGESEGENTNNQTPNKHQAPSSKLGMNTKCQ
jgi:AraC family transcriptional regulator of adaptative response/methylated-DNA-[protein]-cysteine methyltransferase